MFGLAFEGKKLCVCVSCRSVDYNTDVLPLTAPPPLTPHLLPLPDDMASLMDKP